MPVKIATESITLTRLLRDRKNADIAGHHRSADKIPNGQVSAFDADRRQSIDVGLDGLEPSASSLSGKRSNQAEL